MIEAANIAAQAKRPKKDVDARDEDALSRFA
jgi:hypothetical protein